MKEWKKPSIISIDICETMEESNYINICNWNGIEVFGNGNGEYNDPNKKPEQHPTWVWCKVHGRWHPMDHGITDDNINQTS